MLVTGKDQMNEIRRLVTKLEFELFSSDPNFSPDKELVSGYLADIETHTEQLRCQIMAEYGLCFMGGKTALELANESF